MRAVGCVIALALCCTAAGRAQGPRLTAWEVGVASVNGEGSLLQVGYRASWVEQNKLGVDVAVATSPVALMSLYILAAVDLDGVYAVGIDPHVTLVGRAGGTGVVAFGRRDAELVHGYNVGLGLLARDSGASGLRLDFVHRWFPTEYEPYQVTSFTVGVVVYR